MIGNKIIFLVLFLLLACVIVLFSYRIVMKSLSIISPFVIIFLLVTYFILLHKQPISFELTSLNFLKHNVFLDLAKIFVYILANLFLVCELLSSMSTELTNKEKWAICVLVTTVITFFLVCVMLILNVNNTPLPVLNMVKNYGSFLKPLFEIVLVIAIFSTLLSTVFGIKQNSERLFKFKNEKQNLCMFILLIIFVFALSFFNFENLIAFFTPLEAILGLIFLIKSKNK